MCGIFALLCCTDQCSDGRQCKLSQLDLSRECWSNRGPDGLSRMSAGRLHLAGCVLHQRGLQPRLQPAEWLDSDGGEDQRRRLLLWNGELFHCTDSQVDLTGSDTEAVGLLLQKCRSLDELLASLGQLDGPHAFFYYASDLNLVLFGRDLFGRRSLLMTTGTNSGHLVWSSVALEAIDQSADWTEVPAFGVFSLSLTSASAKELVLHPYDLYYPSEAASVTSLCDCPVTLDQHRLIKKFVIDPDAVGVDCPIDTAVSAPVVNDNQQQPDLSVPEWIASEAATFSQLLSESVSCRVRLCSSPYPSQQLLGLQSAVAVLFSGGVDSTLLAALAARLAPHEQSIDLLNVAFEQAPPKVNPTAASGKSRGRKDQERPDATCQEKNFNVPDRLTGIESLDELRQLYPERVFNFVCIDVTLQELQDARNRRISRLCRPCGTVLDDSLGCAVWFAARGEGTLLPEHNEHLRLEESLLYRSPAKVVLCGMGADELLCGYSRHRYIYSQLGYPAVASEVAMEIKRIAQRNLGRDDRMVADHGREARFPYLDERLVNYLANLPPWKKADLSQDRGVGEKLLLRLCAWRLGLCKAAVRPKRAMQFGSRIAKCENRRERGDQACQRLLLPLLSTEPDLQRD